jgi:16S rRNA (uracil1498-N3)-methyltransferase
MPHDRFYIDAPLEPGETVLLADAELHHLTVSRVRVGQCVALINGKGKLAQARLAALDKKQAQLAIETVVQEERIDREIILAQGLARMNHLEWIVEKGTELGVTAFWLFPGHLSEKDTLSDNQRTRLQHLILAAMKQCGRLYLPELLFKPPLSQWTPLSGTLLFADPSPEAPFLWQASLSVKPPLVLFVGPESGFDAKETSHLAHVLRTETAALAGITLLQIL